MALLLVKVVAPLKVAVPLFHNAPPCVEELAEVLFPVKVVAPLKVALPEFHNAPPSVVEALVLKAVVPPSVKVAVL